MFFVEQKLKLLKLLKFIVKLKIRLPELEPLKDKIVTFLQNVFLTFWKLLG